jgi:hypothetical protein
MRDDEALEIAIEDATRGFEAYGYAVLAKPADGGEADFLRDLRAGLEKISSRADWLRRSHGCRSKSKRLLELLHDSLPEPCWGVQPLNADIDRRITPGP